MPDPVRPTDVERPFVTTATGVVQPPGGAQTAHTTPAPVDGYQASAPPPAPSPQPHWLQTGELDARVKTIRSLFKTDQAQDFLYDTIRGILERLITLLQTEPLGFFAVMHRYFEGTVGFFARAGEDTTETIQERPLENREMTMQSIFAGSLIVTIDKNRWLYDGLASINPRYVQEHEAAKANLLKLDNVRFMDALHKELVAIDRWILGLRDSGDDSKKIYTYLHQGLTKTNDTLEYIRALLGNSSRIFSPKAASEPSIVYWGLRAIGHYLSSRFSIPLACYDLIKGDSLRAADHTSSMLRRLKDYISITEANPFTFLPEIIQGLDGWRLTKEAEKLLVEGAPAWLYPLIENMIQNAMRDHLKKDGEFEGMIGTISGDGLPESTPRQIKVYPAKWRVVFVKDNGNGIADDIRPKIFNERVHADTSTHGNGEGLWNSFQLLTRRGWQIWFDTVVGAGTTFYVAMPAEPDGFVSEGGDSGGDAAGQDAEALLGAGGTMLGAEQYGVDPLGAGMMGMPALAPIVPRIR